MPVRAVVNYIVYWRKEGAEKEIRIILPELYVKKRGTDVKASNRATLTD